MRRRPRSRQYHASAEINITNLVDVVLVLLIIFMISAPLLQSGIEINMPKTRAAIKTEPSEGVVLTIDAKGGIFVNDEFANPDNLGDKVKDAMSRKNTENVYVRADSAIAYGKAIDVIARLREAGVTSIGLVTAHEQPRKGQK
jgi:biopolymer transport protein ExbD